MPTALNWHNWAEMLQSPRLLYRGRDLRVAVNAALLEWPSTLVAAAAPLPREPHRHPTSLVQDWQYSSSRPQGDQGVRRRDPPPANPEIGIDEARKQHPLSTARDRTTGSPRLYRPTLAALYEVNRHKATADNPYQLMLPTTLEWTPSPPSPYSAAYVIQQYLHQLEFESSFPLLPRLQGQGIPAVVRLLFLELKRAYQPKDLQKALKPVAEEVMHLQQLANQKLAAIAKEINLWQTQTLPAVRCGDEIDPVLSAATSVIALGFICDLAQLASEVLQVRGGLMHALMALKAQALN